MRSCCSASSKGRTRRFEKGPGPGARKRQLWQSAEVRRVSFFSATYLSAAALTIGLMICSSAW